MYGKVIQLYIFFFQIFSITHYYKILDIIPCAIPWVLFGIYFIYNSVYLLIPNSYFISPSLPFSFGNHKIIFYVCESISVL